MADNDTLPATGDVIRSKDRAGVKTQVVGLDVGIGGTEQLMAAAALADATANPTIPSWGSFGLMWNGTTWDRVAGTAANGVDVDVTRLPALATGANTIGAVLGAQPATTTGNLTAAQATIGTPVAGGTVAAAVTGYGNATITISGTFTGLNASFEASEDGGTTYYVLQAQRESDGCPISSTGVIATAANTYMYLVSLAGVTHLRVRAAAWASGTAAVRISPGSMPFEPVVSAVTIPVVGTPAKVNVAASASSVTLRAANVFRKGLMISNQGTSTLFVDLTGGTATTTTANSFLLAANATWEMSAMTFTTGLVTGIWTATGGSGANVTEFT
jgi:hypothetical protein